MSPQLLVVSLVLGSLSAAAFGWRMRGGLAIGPGLLLFGLAAAWAVNDARGASDEVTICVIVAVAGLCMFGASAVSATKGSFSTK